MESKIDAKSYILLLENEEYELIMTLFESFIEFKLVPKKSISDYIYTEKFDLSTINDRKYLILPKKDLKKAFGNFDKLLNDKKAKLIKARGDNINLIFKINIMDEEYESKLELKQIKINKEEGYPILLNKIKELEKKIIELEKKLNTKVDIMYEDYLKKKQEEEEKQKKEKLIRQEEEKKLKLNDNVNLINDFQTQNNDMKEIYSISNDKFQNERNNIAVYPIIRNDERLYELACTKEDNNYNNYKNIVIYNILLKKKTNVIFNSHVNGSINNLKHYYYSSEKKHFLLSSNQYEIKLWNISSEIITNELTITAEKNLNFNKNNNNNSYSNKDNYIPEYYYYFNCSCLLFNKDSYIIFGGTDSEIKIFNGNFRSNLGNKQINGVNYIEATYVGDKSYIILAGQNTQSYDFETNIIKEYKSKNQNISTYCITLFNKNNKIYLITSCNDGRVYIFDFNTAEVEGSITVYNSSQYIYGLCSLNENYFLAGVNKEIKVIDFEKRGIRNYDLQNFGEYEEIKGLEKIKIPDKGEFIISYSEHIITLWKLNKLQ